MDRSPPETGAQRWVPLGYLALAHLALGAACGVTLWDSSQISGFFYHPKMIAVVHSLTLGWISSTLTAVLYMAAPRLGFRASKFDVWILVAWGAGASGLVSHFWIETYNGMVWSAGLLGVAVLLAAGRFTAATTTCPLPAHVKLQINLAWLNLVVTAFIGLLLGFNRTTSVLPGYSLHNVFAHAHMAAIGWAFLLGVATGHLYVAATAVPRGVALLSLVGTGLTQVGAVGLFVTLLTGDGKAVAFGLTALAGMALCLGSLVWIFATRIAASRHPAQLSFAAAMGWLVIAAWILLRSDGPTTDPDAVMAYGVAALLGGLGQGVGGLGMLWSQRTFPVLAGRWAGWPAVAGWLIAPPLLMIGLGETRPVWILCGVAVLFLAVAWTALRLVVCTRIQSAGG